MRVPRNWKEYFLPFLGIKMLFVHTPKCGGIFVSSAFKSRFTRCPSITWKEARGHKTFQEYKQIFAARGDNLDNYIVFSVIRNPWDWHVSFYNYVSKELGGRESGMLVEHEQIKNMTFEQYIYWLDDPKPICSKDDYMRKQISDWIIDKNGNIGVKYILRQENLQTDLIDFSKKLNLKIDIQYGQYLNKSRSKRGYRWAYSTDTAEIVANRHSRDIELFGYEF